MGDFRAGLVSCIAGNEGMSLEALVGEIGVIFVFIEGGIRFFLLR